MWKRASATAESGRSRLRSFLLILGIVLLAANLRPALTSVAPLIGQIRADTGMSNGVAGLLTTLPLLAFGLLAGRAARSPAVRHGARAAGESVRPCGRHSVALGGGCGGSVLGDGRPGSGDSR